MPRIINWRFAPVFAPQQGQRIGESFRVAELILEQKEDLTRLATMGSLFINRLIPLDYVRTRDEPERSRKTANAGPCVALIAQREMLGVTKPVMVVTSSHTKEVEDRIDRDYNARRDANQFPFTQQQLLSAAERADALFITPADRLDSGFFQKVSPTVKIIATYSVGFEHIDLEAAARRKIPVAYAPGVNSEATADIAILLLLGCFASRLRGSGTGSIRSVEAP